jgi:Carboxypeptidase regulatory-like domain
MMKQIPGGTPMRLAKFIAFFLVTGLSATSPFAQSSPPPERSQIGGTISGRVVVGGRPLPRATITLWQQPLAEPIGNNVEAAVQCNEQGEYTITSVRPGNYFIAASAKGFISGKENKVFANLRFVNSITNGSSERIDFELVPEGRIKGVVTDADGKPIAHIPVNIFTQIEPVGSGPPAYAKDLRTDDQGNYEITKLPAGKYRVSAGYYPLTNATVFGRAGYRRTFYGGADTEASAQVIDVAQGTEVANININVGAPVKTFSVQAKIIDDQTGKEVGDLTYGLEAYSNGQRIGGAVTHARSNDKGEIHIDGVPPGEYSIRVPGGSGIIPKGEIPLEANIFGQSKHFTVTDGDVADLEIRVTRATTVSGFVVIEGAASADVLTRVSQMHLVAMLISSPMIHASIKPDASFVVAGLKPGKVRFAFMGPVGGTPLPLKFVRIERDGAVFDQEIEVKAGEQVTGLRLVLVYANSSVHGVVNLDGGPLPPGTTGVASLLHNGKGVEGVRGELSARGEFLLQHLWAGEYTLALSVRDTVNDRYWRTEQPITISDNTVSESVVTLKSASASSSGQRRP